jgi:hypothetical protein
MSGRNSHVPGTAEDSAALVSAFDSPLSTAWRKTPALAMAAGGFMMHPSNR